MNENNDISKIIGVIMENPDLIERIKLLAAEKNVPESQSVSVVEEIPKTFKQPNLPEEKQPEAKVESNDHEGKRESKKKRTELLYALKPYLSNERSRAVETMLSVMDILDIVKEK